MAASLVGIRSNQVYAMTFALGAALAGVAGMLLGSIYVAQATIGGLVSLKAFVVVILGGMGSFAGAIVGGLILGDRRSSVGRLYRDRLCRCDRLRTRHRHAASSALWALLAAGGAGLMRFERPFFSSPSLSQRSCRSIVRNEYLVHIGVIILFSVTMAAQLQSHRRLHRRISARVTPLSWVSAPTPPRSCRRA